MKKQRTTTHTHALSSAKLYALRISARKTRKPQQINRPIDGQHLKVEEGVAGGDISNLSLSESFRAARCMIIQHFWYTHTRMLHTYREAGAHTHSSQLVTVRGDLVQVEICDAQGVCVSVESDFGETTQRALF